MYWSRFRRWSLRAQLLALLLPTVLVIVGIELLATRYSSVDAANAAYDRSVVGALRSLDANISTASGGLSIELPYRLFEFFELTASGDVYFRVATGDGLVEIGSPDLPMPDMVLEPDVPVFYDATYFGQSLRLGAYMRKLADPVVDSDNPYVIIQVAENTASRDAFTRHLMMRAVMRDLGVLVAVALALVFITHLATRPVSDLAEHIRARPASNLAPLNMCRLPADVSVLVAAINHLLFRSQRILEQQRMFVDDASHQLRTPLATLRTQLDYARLTKDPVQVRETLDALARQVDQATHSTNQLLALARSDTAALSLESFDALQLLREVALRLVPLARARNIDFGIDTETTVEVLGDYTLLREAVFNLADNAIRHTPSGAAVTLRAGADDCHCWMEVSDAGPGMPAEISQSAGQRFIRGRRSDGAGLGLAIVRAVADRHHGTLSLISEPGRTGLTATLRWPACSISNPEVRANENPAA